MKTSGFLLYRLNFVDREDLFQGPITTDNDFIRVVETSASYGFDVLRKGARSDYRWALRQVVSDSTDEVDRRFVFVTMSCEVLTRRGPIITPDGITSGTSMVSPPAATLVRILIDIKRHIFAIEDVPSVIQTGRGWKASLQDILNKAAWELGFTSMIRLTPVIPAETFAIRLRAFEKVTRLRVTLRIPNPDLGPSYRRLYDDMKEGGVRELSQDMRNERGLTVASDTLPQAVIDMAVSGYRKGRMHVYGYRGGQKDDFTVDNDVARIEIEDLREFIEGYAAGQTSAAVKRFAQAIVKRIDSDLTK
jgi:hypothetical protein